MGEHHSHPLSGQSATEHDILQKNADKADFIRPLHLIEGNLSQLCSWESSWGCSPFWVEEPEDPEAAWWVTGLPSPSAASNIFVFTFLGRKELALWQKLRYEPLRTYIYAWYSPSWWDKRTQAKPPEPSEQKGNILRCSPVTTAADFAVAWIKISSLLTWRCGAEPEPALTSTEVMEPQADHW